MTLTTIEMKHLYERYVRVTKSRNDKVLSYEEWREYRNKLVGR